MNVALTVSVDEATSATLDEIALARGLSREVVAERALAESLAFEAEQTALVREGLAAAQRGDFATDEEVERVLAKYRHA